MNFKNLLVLTGFMLVAVCCSGYGAERNPAKTLDEELQVWQGELIVTDASRWRFAFQKMIEKARALKSNSVSTENQSELSIFREKILGPLVVFSQRQDIEGAAAIPEKKPYNIPSLPGRPATKEEMLASVLSLFRYLADGGAQSTSALTAILTQVPEDSHGESPVHFVACELISETHDRDEANEIISARWIQRRPFDVSQTRAIFDAFPDGGIVRKAFIDACVALPVDRVPVQCRSLLMSTHFSKNSARELVTVAMTLMRGDQFTKNVDQQFWPMILISHASWYRGIITSSEHKQLHEWLSGPDELKAHVALWLLLLSEDRDQALDIITSEADHLAERWLADGFVDPKQDSPSLVQHLHDALILAFLPKWTPSPEIRDIVIKMAGDPDYPGRGKVCANGQAWLSIALRNWPPMKDRPYWFTHWRITSGSYLDALTLENSGVVSDEVNKDSYAWKTFEKNQSDIPAMMEIARACPNWARSREAFTKGMEFPDLSQQILDTLAELGPVGSPLVDGDHLKAWLDRQLNGSPHADRAIPVKIARVWYSVLGDKEAAMKILAGLPAIGIPMDPSPAKTWQWDDSVELLILLQRDSPKLDEFRERLQADPGPGKDFRLWLLDLRRGRHVDDLPRTSLVDAKWHPQFTNLARALALTTSLDSQVVRSLYDPFLISDCATCGLDRRSGLSPLMPGYMDEGNHALGLLGAIDHLALFGKSRPAP